MGVTLDDGDSSFASAALRAAVTKNPAMADHRGVLNVMLCLDNPGQGGRTRQSQPEAIASTANSTVYIWSRLPGVQAR